MKYFGIRGSILIFEFPVLRPDLPHITQELHFIVGIGRSGTTLLTKLLNNHPAIHCLPEANFLVFCLHSYKDRTHFTEQEISLIFEQIKTYSLTHPWIGWDFDPVQVKHEVLEQLRAQSAMSYEQLCKLIYSHFKVSGEDKSGAKILLDKNPSYTLFTKHIGRSFPQSKFILLVRDYRANVLSRKQSVYMKSPHVAFNAHRWRLFNKLVMQWHKRHPEKMIVVRYEDLVRQPDAELARICKFLTIDASLNLTESSTSRRIDYESYQIDPRHKERFVKKYSDLNKTISADRLEAWQTQLPAEEIRTCDAICSGFAARFGYKAFTRVTMLDKVKHLPSWLSACKDVYKDLLIYYFSPAIKLARLKKTYQALGFNAK